MRREHYEHLDHVLLEITKRMAEKYIHGQTEHGGELWKHQLKSLLEEALSEAIDQCVYLQTALDQVDKFVKIYDD